MPTQLVSLLQNDPFHLPFSSQTRSEPQVRLIAQAATAVV
jgi:hypothetical protein